MLKILTSEILLQEVPNEISLGLAITGCPYRCAYCHTPELQQDIGESFEFYSQEIERYKNAITCVLFLGGDGREEELALLAKKIKEEYGLKTAVYLGGATVPKILIPVFDYIKTGPYIHSLGGLESPTTNQRMYRIAATGDLEDITYLFIKGE